LFNQSKKERNEMKNVLIFVALLLVAVFSVTIADARDCTTCPNNEQCTAPLPPTKVIAKGGVLDDNILKMVPDKTGVVITCKNGEKYIAKKKLGNWTLECTNGQCYRPSLIPRVKAVEKECIVVEKTEKKTAYSAPVVYTTKARWSQKCGRRGIQRLAHRPLLRNIGWRLRHIGCHRQ
jgi:hypothetical protein